MHETRLAPTFPRRINSLPPLSPRSSVYPASFSPPLYLLRSLAVPEYYFPSLLRSRSSRFAPACPGRPSAPPFDFLLFFCLRRLCPFASFLASFLPSRGLRDSLAAGRRARPRIPRRGARQQSSFQAKGKSGFPALSTDPVRRVVTSFLREVAGTFIFRS